MTASADRKSTKADTIHKSGKRQRIDAAEFGARIRAAMAEKGLKNSDLADISGVSRQLVSEYSNGQKVAGADNLFAMADALGVYARWLLREEGPKSPEQTGENVKIDRYDAFAFGEYGKGEPVEEIVIPRWLLGPVKHSHGIWLCEMPSDALPSVAREGEMVICRDAEIPLQDRRVYIFLIDGRPVVRRVFVRPDGLQLAGENDDATINVRAEDTDQVVPVARVLAAISLHQV